MTETKLKPCPFCGGKAKCIEFYGMYHVICCDCYIAGRDTLTRDKAIESWNTRPIEDAKDEEIKRLREALEKAQYYLKKVDCYIIPIADEADYFAKVRIDEILKGGQE